MENKYTTLSVRFQTPINKSYNVERGTFPPDHNSKLKVVQLSVDRHVRQKKCYKYFVVNSNAYKYVTL